MYPKGYLSRGGGLGTLTLLSRIPVKQVQAGNENRGENETNGITTDTCCQLKHVYNLFVRH